MQKALVEHVNMLRLHAAGALLESASSQNAVFGYEWMGLSNVMDSHIIDIVSSLRKPFSTRLIIRIAKDTHIFISNVTPLCSIIIVLDRKANFVRGVSLPSQLYCTHSQSPLPV